MAMHAWYIEYGSGYCTVVHATTRDAASRKAGESRVPGDWQRSVRLATDEDIAHFTAMGGAVR